MAALSESQRGPYTNRYVAPKVWRLDNCRNRAASAMHPTADVQMLILSEQRMAAYDPKQTLEYSSFHCFVQQSDCRNPKLRTSQN